jgi:hypothetical protein
MIKLETTFHVDVLWENIEQLRNDLPDGWEAGVVVGSSPTATVMVWCDEQGYVSPHTVTDVFQILEKYEYHAPIAQLVEADGSNP